MNCCSYCNEIFVNKDNLDNILKDIETNPEEIDIDEELEYSDDSDDNTEPMDPPPPHQQPLSNSIWDHKLVDNSPGINPFQSTNPQAWTDYLYPIDSLEEIREYEETRNMEDEDYYWE
jgi:hypothetical protein